MASARWFIAASIATLAVGCSTDNTSDTGDNGVVATTGGDHQPPPPPPPQSCKPLGLPGIVVEQIPIVGGNIVATDRDGNVFYTADAGFVKLSANGQQVFAFRFGSVLAVDALGNAYVAGSFTSPIDLGMGTMVPNGNIDVFVAKLSPSGKLIFAEQLGLCGDGVESIAVDRHGNIAVSGTAMGTAILDARGNLKVTLAFSGKLAFDSKGDLFVAGSFAGSIDFGGGHVLRNGGDVDGFLVKLDPLGNHLFSMVFGDAQLPVNNPGFGTVTVAQFQSVDNIAINANDELAIVGSFRQEMDLFGVTMTAPQSIIEAKPPFGSFVVRLDASGQVSLAQSIGTIADMDGVAIDLDGNLAVSASVIGHATARGSYPLLVRIGQDRFAIGGNGGFNGGITGQGLGVAMNACGDVFFASVEDFSSPNGLEPRAFLDLVAR